MQKLIKYLALDVVYLKIKQVINESGGNITEDSR